MDIFVFASEQWILISVLLMLIYVFAFTERTKGGKPISATELVSLMNSEQAQLVDVRASADFQAGHVHGAMNIPHTQMASRGSELEKHRSKIIVLTDQMGQQSRRRKLLAFNGSVVRLKNILSEKPFYFTDH